MKYYKSIYTNSIYEMIEPPQYGGYVEVTRAEYETWCKKRFGRVL